MMVLAAFGVAFCQGITESGSVDAIDSTIVNAIPAAGDSTKSGTDIKAGTTDAAADSWSTILQNDSSGLISDSASIQNSSDIPVVSGELVKNEDSVKTITSTVKSSEHEKKNAGGRNGIGINLTAKLIVSRALNDYFEDLYEKMKDDANGTISNETGISAMPIMIGLKVKGIIYVGPVLGLEPFGTINYGIKLMRIRNLDKDVNINLIEYGGGLNMWARVSPARVVSFKAGLGGYVTYTYLNVESYDGTVDHSGIGGGMNILAGIDITLKKITINMDFSVPIGSSELSQDGKFTNRGNYQIRYPDGYRHTGIEIRPGVTFHF
jgi:hypothetical protein